MEYVVLNLTCVYLIFAGWLKATAQRGNKEDASFSLAEE